MFFIRLTCLLFFKSFPRLKLPLTHTKILALHDAERAPDPMRSLCDDDVTDTDKVNGVLCKYGFQHWRGQISEDLIFLLPKNKLYHLSVLMILRKILMYIKNVVIF